MATIPQIRGMLLEEALLHLLRRSGYLTVETDTKVNKLISKNIELAVKQYESNNLNGALLELKDILSIHKKNLSNADLARVHTIIASVYLELYSFDESEEHLRIALKLKPKDIRLHTNLSTLYNARSDYQTAREILEKAFNKMKPNARALSLYSNILFALGEDEAAKEQAQHAIDSDYNIAQGHLVKGLVLRGQAVFDEALTELEIACELDSKYYFAQGIRLETLALLAANDLSPVDVEDIDKKCFAILYEIDQMPKPLPRYIIIAQAVLYSAQGLVLSARNMWDSAADAFLKQLEIGDDSIGRQNLGMAYINLRKYDKADVEFRKAVELGNCEPFVYNNIAARCLNLFQEKGFSDESLLNEAKEFFNRYKAALPDDIETGFLEANIVLVESEYKRSDMGIGKAKSLLDIVIRDIECPEDLSILACKHYMQAEELEKKIENSRRVPARIFFLTPIR